jgi:hypothetical protein
MVTSVFDREPGVMSRLDVKWRPCGSAGGAVGGARKNLKYDSYGMSQRGLFMVARLRLLMVTGA